MRLSSFHLLPTTLLLSLATALQLPEFQLLPFLSAVPETRSNETVLEDAHDLLKRASSCPSGFNSCSNLGAPGLCCASAAVCSADAASEVACCPSGAVCTGNIGSYITSGTVNSNGQLIGATSSTTSFQYYGGSTTTAVTTAAAASSAAATNSDGFIIAASSVVATPAAANRRAEVPLLVQAIAQFVQYLPL